MEKTDTDCMKAKTVTVLLLGFALGAAAVILMDSKSRKRSCAVTGESSDARHDTSSGRCTDDDCSSSGHPV